MKNVCFLLLGVLFFAACNNQETAFEGEKFEPEDGKCLVFVGQELEAVGGLADYNDGYYDHFDQPYGFTMYTDLMPGSESFGFVHKGLDGLTTTDDWGDSGSNMSLQIADEDFNGGALAIGLDMKMGHDTLVYTGAHDSLILVLANWVKNLGDRQVFLRIGYEFDGHDWNAYDKDSYLKSYRRIKDMFDSLNVENVAYVWQSKGRGSFRKELDAWYPGDDYVDWCAFSFFAPDNEHHPMIQFARDHNKPVFLAEATPILVEKDSFPPDSMYASIPEHANRAWEEWFIPFFRTIENNADVIKAFSYINCNWKAHPMWKENPYFQHVDARLHLNEGLAKKWKAKMKEGTYVLKN
jgi:hypothetical protein